MQARMKNHKLTTEQIDELLKYSSIGHLGTINNDGTPYVLPVHFVSYKNKVYIHGLSTGTKLNNIKNTPAICFEVEKMSGLILDDKACDVNTKYQSVVISGNACLIEDPSKKTEILQQIVSKYTPQLSGQTFPDSMIKGTGIIEIDPSKITGKYYE